MVQLTTIISALALSSATVATVSLAHPGQQHQERSLQQVADSQSFRSHAHRSLAACANSKHMRELQQRAANRRLASVKELRADIDAANRRRRALRSEVASDVLATSHKSNLSDINPSAIDQVELFGATAKCVLEPDVTQGPYYVNGELIRRDVRESQQGIDLYTQVQFIDINNCSPVENYYVDFWHANSTGVYSGVVADGNGDASDLANINTTYNRGIYPTDKDGLVQYISKFPGHYTGRATHIHLLGNHGGEVLSNNTYVGGGVGSVGQVFFDQDLISAVEATGIYSTNTQAFTTNAEDPFLTLEAVAGFDPVLEYVYLGNSVTDGIFAWISVGVNTSESKYITSASTWTKSGGVANAYNDYGLGDFGAPPQ